MIRRFTPAARLFFFCLIAAVALPTVSHAATITVNTTADFGGDSNPGDGICAFVPSGGQCTLRAAIMEANALAGPDTIIVPAGTYTLALAGVNENAGATGDLDITTDITIIGGGGNADASAAATIIQAQSVPNADFDRVFHVNPLGAGTANATFKALTIRHGSIPGGSSEASGAAIEFEPYGNTSSLTLYNVVLDRNRTSGASNVQGGAGGAIDIYNYYPTSAAPVLIDKCVISNNEVTVSNGGAIAAQNVKMTIRDTTFSGNRSTWAPGASRGGAIVISGSYSIVQVERSLFTGNTADDSGYGGAIHVTAGTLVVTNSTFSANVAKRAGGAISFASGTLQMTNVTVTGNTAGETGGGMSITGGSTTMNNSIVWGNVATTTPGEISGTLGIGSRNNLVGSVGTGGIVNGINGNKVGVDPLLLPLGSNGGPTQTHALQKGSPALDAGENAFAVSTDQRGRTRVLDAAGESPEDTTATVDIGAFELSPTIGSISAVTATAREPLSIPLNVGGGIVSITAVSSRAFFVPNDEAHLTVVNPTSATPTLVLTGVMAGKSDITVTVTGAGGATDTVTFTATIVGKPDLRVSMSHSGSVRQGSTPQYNVTVTNGGTSGTRGDVNVTVTWPAGLAMRMSLDGNWLCSNSGSTTTCSRFSSLGVNSSWTLPLLVDVTGGPGTVTSTVSVSNAEDTNASNDTGSDTTVILPTSDLGVVITGPASVLKGQAATNTIVVTNDGPDATSGTITLTDTLPAGLTVTSASGTDWTCTAASPVVCTRTSPLASGASTSITVAFTVDESAADSVTNTVALAHANDLNGANDGASRAMTVLSVPDLTVTKTHAGNFRQGGVGTYTVTVTNGGSVATSGTITLTDTIPPGLTVRSISGSGWTCSAASATCTTDAIAAAGSSLPPITVEVDVASNAAASVTNTVTVSGGGESNTSNDTASDPTAVDQVADLAITKTDGGATFTQGESGTYSITVTNVGSGPTVGLVTVRDADGSGFTVANLSGTGWTCAGDTCTRSDVLAAGASYPAITATVGVGQSTGRTITNTATVSGGGELDTSNDTASDTTSIRQLPDLEIELAPAGTFAQGQAGAQYTITVTNGGTGLTTGTVQVGLDRLDASLTPVSFSGTGWTCTFSTLTCTRTDELSAGASYDPVVLVANVSPTAPATVQSSAYVGGGDDQVGANNVSALTTAVLQKADLVVAMSHAGNFYAGQSGAQYRLVVTNTGVGATDAPVAVTDVLPAGLSLVSMSGSGWTCAGATCTRADVLAAGASYPAITVAVNVSSGATGSVTNTATVTGGGQLDTSNDSASDATTIVSITLTSSLPPAAVGATYDATLTASGGIAPYTFSITSGSFPAGLTLGADGHLSGTPTAGGSFPVTVTARDASPAPGPYPGSKSYTLIVAEPTITLAPATLPAGSFKAAYSQTLSAAGGTAPHSFAITAGSPPPGLLLTAAGVLSGTATAAGTFDFTVTATDSSTGSGPYSGSRGYSISIAKASTTAAIVAPAITFGADATATVSVSSAAGAPAGNVELIVDGGTPRTAGLASGSATFTLAGLTAGSHSLRASYAGDASFDGSSATASLSVNKSTATFTVAAPKVTYGSAATITITSTSGKPTGSVNVTVDGVTRSTLLADGAASIAFDALNAGSYPVSVSYAGDANFEAGNAASTLTVARAATTVAITATSPARSTPGQLVTISFAVSAGAGTVRVMSGSDLVCSASASAGSCTFAFERPGTFDLIAGYDGDSNHEPSTSTPVAHEVAWPAGTATVSGDATTCQGNGVTIAVRLTGAAPWTLAWSDGLTETTNDALHARVVAPQQTTVYRLTSARDAHGAMTIDGSAEVTVREQAAAPSIAGPASVILGQPFELSATPGFDRYEWFLGDVRVSAETTRVLHVPAATAQHLGSYRVVGFTGECASRISASFDLRETEQLIAAIVGSVRGANGSRFRSAMRLFNPGPGPFEGEFWLLTGGQNAVRVPLQLMPYETQWLDDVFASAGSGIGSANLVVLRGSAPLGLVHVYNDGGENGTTGLLQTLVDSRGSIEKGDKAVLIAPAEPAATRFNVGVRALQSGASLRLTLRTAAGSVRALVERVFGPSSFTQLSAADLLGFVPGPSDAIVVEVLDGSAIVYGAATDNRTNDPNIQFARQLGGAAESRRILPVVGSTAGAFGSRFRTSVQLHNASSDERSVRVTFQPNGVTKPFTVGANATLAIDDLLVAMGTSGIGSADLEAADDVVALVRVYNDGEGQTSMVEEPVGADEVLRKGMTATTLAPQNPSAARFNVGVRALGEGVRLVAKVRSSSGVLLGERELAYAANAFQQAPASALLGHAFTGGESVTWEVKEGAAVIYGVWTDNLTQDPSYHRAQ